MQILNGGALALKHFMKSAFLQSPCVPFPHLPSGLWLLTGYSHGSRVLPWELAPATPT